MNHVTGTKLLFKRHESRKNRSNLVGELNVFPTFIYCSGLIYFDIGEFILSFCVFNILNLYVLYVYDEFIISKMVT